MERSPGGLSEAPQSQGAGSRAYSPPAVPSCFARESSGLGSACLCTPGFGSSGSSSSGVTSFIRLWLHTLATSLMPESTDVRSRPAREPSLTLRSLALVRGLALPRDMLADSQAVWTKSPQDAPMFSCRALSCGPPTNRISLTQGRAVGAEGFGTMDPEELLQIGSGDRGGRWGWALTLSLVLPLLSQPVFSSTACSLGARGFLEV